MNSVLYNGIKDFIEKGVNGDNEMPVPIVALQQYDEIIKSLGFKEYNDFETNGWQVDFWQTYKKEKMILTLGGSLWYGNYKLTKEKIDV